MKLPIYMDNHATTRVDREVLEEMLPCFSEHYGNPESATHVLGKEAEDWVEKARVRVSKLIHAHPQEIIFTSGATESNNLVLKGLAKPGAHFISVATEHKSILDPLRFLESTGCSVTLLKVNPEGLIDLNELRNAISNKTILISVMAANNEIGVIQPIGEIANIAREKGILFHSDATQSIGRIPFDVNALGLDMVSFTAHKMYGPKGVGALWIKKKQPKIHLVPQLHGGGHEEGMRSGTLNVPGIVGFGKASEIAGRALPEEIKKISALRDRLLAKLKKELDCISENGSMKQRLPGNLNLCFEGAESAAVLLALHNEVALSTGSACSSARVEPSHVLKALGLPDKKVMSSIRFGIGRFNTPEEIDTAVEKIVPVVKRLRAMAG